MPVHWNLALEDTFVETTIDGQVGFVRDDQAVILAPFDTMVEPDEALDQVGLTLTDSLEHIEREGSEIRREAVIRERVEDGVSRFALEGFAATRGSLVAIGVYYEQAGDRDWALATFRSLSATDEGEPDS